MTKYENCKTTVTDGQVTKMQPIVSTSVSTGSFYEGAILHVKRHYNNLTNEFCGKGRIKALDADGKIFPTAKAAWEYAYIHGYIREHFTHPELRKSRKERARK